MMRPTATAYFLSLCGFLNAATIPFNNLQELLSIKDNVDANLNTLFYQNIPKDFAFVVESLSMMRPTAFVNFLSFCELRGAATITFDNLQEFVSIKDNVDANLNTLELIKKAGYPAESHVVLTEDGYFLTIHRIPGGKNSPPVLLQHCILCNSVVWVILGKEKALAFILADQGYDVWLGNFRGNTYSRAHISVSPLDSKFWDFSFDEMGMYDLPAMISHITNLTLKPLHTYIGHSMGTTTYYVMAIKRPEIAKMVKMMISLAPVAFVGNTTSPIRFFAPFTDSIEAITRFLGVDELTTLDSVLHFLARWACNVNPSQKEICSNLIFQITGFDKEQFNYTLLPVVLNHFPSGALIKTILHYMQEVKSSKFCAYDYGREKNMQIYNATTPPDYDLSRITTPIALFYADNDWFVNEKDLKILRASLTNIVDDYRVPFPKFTHVDFLWAKDAPTLVYEKVLKIMKKDVNSNEL